MSGVRFDEPAAGVGRITLDRPERRNALSFGLVAELHDLLDEVAGSEPLRAVVLAAEGPSFCAGLDLADWGEPPDVGAHRQMTVGRNGQSFLSSVVAHVHRLPQIVVAAVQGAAFGGGLSLACAADVRVVAPDARLCAAFIRTGLSGTDFGISYLLPRIVGAGRALDLIASGREVDGVEAERIGLASQVADDPGAAALGYAAGVAAFPRTGLVLTKEAFWHNVEAPSLEAAMAMEDRNQLLASAAPDVQAFMAAYRERITRRS
ncbi:MAG: enoyl-CoA hydratase/isomerase family protein [Acidimicrobiales bacterium]|nr:enoyl-CoA hydratase/isomerase family protein [Acidimicrobiales bacterium]